MQNGSQQNNAFHVENKNINMSLSTWFSTRFLNRKRAPTPSLGFGTGQGLALRNRHWARLGCRYRYCYRYRGLGWAERQTCLP